MRVNKHRLRAYCERNDIPVPKVVFTKEKLVCKGILCAALHLYDGCNHTIKLKKGFSKLDMEETFLHELRHVWQATHKHDWFMKSAYSTVYSGSAYRENPVEIDARSYSELKLHNEPFLLRRF